MSDQQINVNHMPHSHTTENLAIAYYTAQDLHRINKHSKYGPLHIQCNNYGPDTGEEGRHFFSVKFDRDGPLASDDALKYKLKTELTQFLAAHGYKNITQFKDQPCFTHWYIEAPLPDGITAEQRDALKDAVNHALNYGKPGVSKNILQVLKHTPIPERLKQWRNAQQQEFKRILQFLNTPNATPDVPPAQPASAANLPTTVNDLSDAIQIATSYFAESHHAAALLSWSKGKETEDVYQVTEHAIWHRPDIAEQLIAQHGNIYPVHMMRRLLYQAAERAEANVVKAIVTHWTIPPELITVGLSAVQHGRKNLLHSHSPSDEENRQAITAMLEKHREKLPASPGFSDKVKKDSEKEPGRGLS